MTDKIPKLNQTHTYGMNAVRDRLLEFMKNEDIKKCVREVCKPVVSIIYNELYIYIWAISLYNILLILITLVNLYILHKILKK